MRNGMLPTGLRALLLNLLFALLSGIITSVILLGALLIGLASMVPFLDITTQPSAEAAKIGPTLQMAALAVLFASLLATAPLIGWWYNFLLRAFSVDTLDEEEAR